VQDGAEEHLQDLSELVKEEWESVEPAIITHCWVKARLQRVEMETHLNAQNGELPPLLARRVQRRCEDDCPTCVGLHVWGRLCRRGWARPSGVGVAGGGGRGRPAWAWPSGVGAADGGGRQQRRWTRPTGVVAVDGGWTRSSRKNAGKSGGSGSQGWMGPSGVGTTDGRCRFLRGWAWSSRVDAADEGRRGRRGRELPWGVGRAAVDGRDRGR